MRERTAKHLGKPREKRAPKFGEKPKRPRSWQAPPNKPEGQPELDFDSDLTPEQLAVFA